MKKTLSLVTSGFIGAVIALIGFQMMQPDVVGQNMTSPTLVNSVQSNTPSGYPFDFVKASKVATSAVVQINAKESDQLAYSRNKQQRRQLPQGGMMDLNDFFGGAFGGGDFFGYGQPRAKAGSGSGVIVSSDGYIVTNNHVAGFADEIEVILSDKKRYKAIKIGTDPSTDLALLKIEASGLNAIEFTDSDKLEVGEWVLAVGNPFSYLTSTVTAGIVSAKGRDIDIIEGQKAIEEFIQTDAAVNPGNSGGALVDNEGKLVGINTAIATPTGSYAGYSFAIPSNLVKRIIKDIKENGDIRRGSIGISGYNINAELSKQLGLNVDAGIYVDKVIMRSAAQFAGILPGDIVTKVNNKKVNTFKDITEELKFKKEGDIVDLVVLRNDSKKTIRVKLRSII